jgi:hypothetical protein
MKRPPPIIRNFLLNLFIYILRRKYINQSPPAYNSLNYASYGIMRLVLVVPIGGTYNMFLASVKLELTRRSNYRLIC